MSNDFEDELTRLKLRPIPRHWRDAILGDAPQPETTPHQSSNWLVLCWFRIANSPLLSTTSAIWIAIALLRVSAPNPATPRLDRSTTTTPKHLAMMITVVQNAFSVQDPENQTSPSRDSAAKHESGSTNTDRSDLSSSIDITEI